MKRTLLLTIVLLAALAVTSEPAAQGERRGARAGWSSQGENRRVYDPSTVETISGKVTKIEHIPARGGMREGVHLQLKIDSGTLPVHVGPRWYLDNQNLQIKKGDIVKVTGSKVRIEDKPALIAAEIQRGDDILQLRDKDGFPRWAGWRRRGQ